MYVLSIISFLLLAGLLVFAATRFGIPSMVSDVFYQYQKYNKGWIFSVILAVSALLTLIPILDSSKGIQFLAFLGCVGLIFVGFAPRYLDSAELSFTNQRLSQRLSGAWAGVQALISLLLYY